MVAKAETALTPPERIGLLGDRWALVSSGQAPVGGYLDLVLALKQDPNAAVLDLVHRQLERVDSDIATAEDRAEFAAGVGRRFGPGYRPLGEPGEGGPGDPRPLAGRFVVVLGGVAGCSG